LVGGDEETPVALIVCPGSLLATSFDSSRSERLIWATGSGNGSANDGRTYGHPEDGSRKIRKLVGNLLDCCKRGKQTNKRINADAGRKRQVNLLKH